MSLGLIGFLVAVVLVLGLIAFLAFGQRLKGRLTLNIANRAYNPGEDIEGAVVISAKKELGPGRLFVAFTCTEEWYEWHSNGGQRTRKKRSREVFRHEEDIEQSFSISPGQEQSFIFTLPTPTHDSVGQRGAYVSSDAPAWVGAIAEIANSLTDRDSDFNWKVESQYHIKGLDLSDSQEVSFNHNFF